MSEIPKKSSIFRGAPMSEIPKKSSIFRGPL
jgi:hypothetical protein